MARKPTRDVEKSYTRAQFVSKLRRFADSIEAGEPFVEFVLDHRLFERLIFGSRGAPDQLRLLRFVAAAPAAGSARSAGRRTTRTPIRRRSPGSATATGPPFASATTTARSRGPQTQIRE